MGEVYRADDLELCQSVAFKFLPDRLAQDPIAQERFRGEVRLARQVSHLNVCRVYHLGRMDDQWFLSMEYVDGEDLPHSYLFSRGQFFVFRSLPTARSSSCSRYFTCTRGFIARRCPLRSKTTTGTMETECLVWPSFVPPLLLFFTRPWEAALISNDWSSVLNGKCIRTNSPSLQPHPFRESTFNFPASMSTIPPMPQR